MNKAAKINKVAKMNKAAVPAEQDHSKQYNQYLYAGTISLCSSG